MKKKEKTPPANSYWGKAATTGIRVAATGSTAGQLSFVPENSGFSQDSERRKKPPQPLIERGKALKYSPNRTRRGATVEYERAPYTIKLQRGRT